jgi:hypothetical protein
VTSPHAPYRRQNYNQLDGEMDGEIFKIPHKPADSDMLENIFVDYNIFMFLV